jgi:nucleotide-binding universal stress UspA family protein
MGRFRRILHATDFSRASRAAFTQAVELASANQAELTLVHVYPPVVPPLSAGTAAPEAYRALLAEVQTRAQKELDRLVARAQEAGIPVKGLLFEGTPHDRIVRAAKAAGANLIVVGTHGRTGLARLFLGSVAARVVALAPCPVLTVRGT